MSAEKLVMFEHDDDHKTWKNQLKDYLSGTIVIVTVIVIIKKNFFIH